VNERKRENGAYYDRSFKAAVDLSPSIISITSFNECTPLCRWYSSVMLPGHEGTQIEPAVPKTVAATGYKYEDYGDDPDKYLKKTREWVLAFEAKRGVH
jgi:hypothetical protein